MFRFFMSIVLGCFVSLGLFIFMAKLVENKGRVPEESVPVPFFDIISVPTKAEVNIRPTAPPKPLITPPPSLTLEDPMPPTNTHELGVELTQPTLSLDGTVDSYLHGFNRVDGDAQPIVLIEPKFPLTASRDGITGYVILLFDIQLDGSTGNIKILEAKPRGVFNQEAIRALKKWKYRPKVVGGRSMIQTGLKVRLDFNLDKK